MNYRAFGLALLFGTVGAGAVGCGHHCPWGDDPGEVRAKVGKHLERAMEEAGATKVQAAQLGPIADRLAPGVVTLARQHNQVRKELLAEWQRDKLDRARLDALADGLADAVRAFGKDAVLAVVELHALLTPEQRATLGKHVAELTD